MRGKSNESSQATSSVAAERSPISNPSRGFESCVGTEDGDCDNEKMVSSLFVSVPTSIFPVLWSSQHCIEKESASVAGDWNGCADCWCNIMISCVLVFVFVAVQGKGILLPT